MQISIIIPTFNGSDRIGEVLECLKYQKISTSLSWEVIVVDNNSQDNTKRFVEGFSQDWRADCKLRYVLEPRQGAAFARSRGVAEAQSSLLIGFLDDDNFPSERWVN